MIILENNRLEFRFPEVHEEARCTINSQRTLRIPDDGMNYPLPPGLGDCPSSENKSEGPLKRGYKRGGVGVIRNHLMSLAKSGGLRPAQHHIPHTPFFSRDLWLCSGVAPMTGKGR